MTTISAKTTHARIWLALVLTTVSGFVDAVGYRVLADVLVANMSGNTIAIGRGLAEGDFGLVMRRGSAIPVFVLGMVVSRFCFKLWSPGRITRAVVAVFGLEMLALSVFLALARAGSSLYVLIALAAWAMGLQNAALTHFGPLNVRTTHVTGNLATFAEQLVDALFSWVKHRRPRRDVPASERAWLLFLVWFLYLGGATLGLGLRELFGLSCLAVPIAALLVIIITAVVRPGWTVG